MIAVVLAYVVYAGLMGFCAITEALEDEKYGRYTDIPPYRLKDFYERTEMNWFGCILCWLLKLILNPVYVVGMHLRKPIYWLCHVGRE